MRNGSSVRRKGQSRQKNLNRNVQFDLGGPIIEITSPILYSNNVSKSNCTLVS